MQPVTKFFFGLLLVNVLILNLIYVFSQDGNIRSLKTENVQGLFAKETPVPRPNSVASKYSKAEVSSQKDTNASGNLRKAHTKVPTKESIQNELNAAKELLEKFRDHKAEHLSTKSPFEINPHKLLGGYKKVPLAFYKDGSPKRPNFNKANFHLIHDADYCDRVDMFNLENPENMFQEKNFFTDIVKIHPRTVVIDKIGKVPMKQYFNVFGTGKYSPYTEGKKHHLPLTINNFFVYYFGFHYRHEIGKDFNCATQMYNRIPGHEPMVRKDLSTDNFKSYVKSFGEKTQCVPEGIFPQAYRLYNAEECSAFFDIINSEGYKNSLAAEPLQYLVKVGKDSHRSDGVFLLDGNKTKAINEAFNFGKECGYKSESLIAQAYIANPLLLDMNNKFDFRVYMLIASTDPLIVYYHDGFLRVALSSYDKFSRERGTHLTNTHLAQNKFNEAKAGKTVNGMNETELMEYHLWNFTQLENYLLKNGKTHDKKWLENELRPQFKKAFVHVVKMAQDSLWKGSNVYQLFGLDFMLDENLKLWFIEGNPNPQLGQNTQKAANIINVMFKDLFEVQYAYYKSRMQRLKKVIESVQKEYTENGHVDYREWSSKYSHAMKNRLEKEYAIGKKNTWSIVMDENLPGASAYFGSVPEGCA